MQLNLPVDVVESRCPLLSVLGNLEFSLRIPFPARIRPDDIFYVTQPTDTLPSLAYQFYGDVRLWWVIYDNNAELIMDHPLDMNPGLTLRIPSQQAVDAELLNAGTL